MKTIAIYISDYGYGHASRSIAVIRQLLKEPEVKIIVCHSFALTFIKASLISKHVSYRNIKTDIGYFLENESIHPDKVQLLKEYNHFVSDWEKHIDQEKEFLRLNSVDLVVSDISPLPFEPAEILGIPSVGISNFTWFTAYQGLIGDSELFTFKKAYQKMTYYYSLAGSQEHWDCKTNDYGFYSRDIDLQEVNRIRDLVNPDGKQQVVFLGLGMKIEVGTLEQLPIWDSPNCVFLVSSNVHVDRANVFQIPNDYLESQNYIAASDLVISKAGWGIIGEALCANVPLLILNRPSLKEDQNTINYLKQHQLCKTIEWDDFKSYQTDFIKLSKLENSIKAKRLFSNNQAKLIATDLLEIISEL
ncbi:glycosyltransferase family protein [Neobacillus sp. 179-J 1A1 HS]|uniref:glycosyltransferase family protein n=1 Tax=Neobacillus driksii TaxID=3035913 RepID=UPI0035BBE585